MGYYYIIYDMATRFFGYDTITLLTFAGGAFFVWYRFRKLEKQAMYRQEDTEMMFKCLRACLEGQKQLGANGPVDNMIKELNDYQSAKAAGLPGKERVRG